MIALRWSIAALGFFVYASFVAGVWLVFRKVEPDRSRLKLLKIAAVLAAVLEVRAILYGAVSVSWLVLGGAIYLSSLTLFIVASTHTRHRKLTIAFSQDLPVHLVTTGPWKYVRHPFYLSYLASYVAGLAASWDLKLVGVIAAMAAIYISAIHEEERKMANSELANEWRIWKEKTGMLFPKFF